ncbi:hypothetical protein E5161_06990 [Cohnella pontilimi]|uniref:YheC/YheD family protein n=1 Tax=Cohnella pontilimi TaxID=2564100 RepID=A0A4U0FGT7_9BACL|nr:YheC/YheD family protein [Cohnella pontilimi]TJY42592.1 hypothetical protein E5161_06990 [Cohnella pontilimi]
MALEQHHVKSKLAVAYQLTYTPGLSEYIPPTELFRESAFRRMIKKYDNLYLKPDRGRKSRGVYRIERDSGQRFKIRRGTHTEYVHADDLWRKVRSLTGDDRYVIQKAVDSVTKDGRHFDLRCHALRIDGKWKAVGMCGRLGEKGSVVTTSHYGGTPTYLDTLFSRHLNYSRKEISDMKRRLEKCVVKTVSRVSQMYPNLKEYAVDIGVDRKKRIWIFEVNIEPAIEGNFGKLPDLSLYRKVKKLRKIAK